MDLSQVEFPQNLDKSGPIITVSGHHGSGKSTYAKKIAEEFQLRYISSGEIFRKYAQDHKLSVKELSTKILTLPSLDYLIDQTAIDAAVGGSIVIDASISGWIFREIADLTILITAPLETRVKRVASRDNNDYSEALIETQTREASEKQRYWNLYQIDTDDWSSFDFIFNTHSFSKALSTEILVELVRVFLRYYQHSQNITEK